MRKVLIALAASAVAVATPALANEGRAEVRGGIITGGGTEEAVVGVALGYDWDLGDSAFIGIEASGDKILAGGADISLGLTSRIGFKAGETTKVYIDGGYTVNADFVGDDTPHLGAGVEFGVSESMYAKVGYRHFFSDFVDADAFVVGVGVKF